MALKVASFSMTGGLTVDRQAQGVPPDTWTGATNIDFRDGIAHRAKGYATIGGACSVCAPLSLVAMNAGESYLLASAASYLFYAGNPYAGAPQKIGRVVTSTATHFDESPVAWVAAPAYAGVYSSGLMNGVPYFSHPGYSPVDRRAGAPFAVIPDWAATFAAGQGPLALRNYLEFYFALGMVVGGTNSDPDIVNWSGRAAARTTPAVWTPAAGNAAGNTILAGGGDLVDAVPLGDTLMIYKRRSIWAARYIGGNYIFDFKRVVQGVGALGTNCVAAVGGQHYFLTEDDVMVWNGSGTPVSLLAGKVRKLIVGQSYSANYQTSFLIHMPRQDEIWACIPTAGASYPNRAIVINLVTGQCGVRTLVRITHGTYQREKTNVLSGLVGETVLAYHDSSAASAGLILQMDNADQVNGTDITSTILREKLDFSAPGLGKKVRWVRPWVEPTSGSPPITVSVGGTMRPDTTVSYTGTGTYTPGTSDKVDVSADGRYLSFSFSAASGVGWSIPGFDVGYELGGAE
jgi:hypothetical protein